MIQRCGAAFVRRVLQPALALLLFALPADAAETVFYRIFLRDGSTVVSYGEFARVAGQIVFSIPITGADTAAPQLQLVSLSESLVDVDRTETYAQAARAKHYAETRGESDFVLLSNEVARVLNEVAFTQDPAKRLALADQARRTLAEWPTRNYGYRAGDVAQLTSLLDEVVSELRVAAGQSGFELSLVATTAPPPPMPLLPPPTLRDSVEQALTVARMSTDPTQRVSLLRAIADVLTGPSNGGGWAAALRARASAELTTELKLDEAYANLSERILATAEQKRRRADVKGIESLVKQVLQADDRFNHARPQAAAALLSTLDAQLDAVRRLRLARDRWSLQLAAVRGYEQRTHAIIERFFRSRPLFEQIRQLAGPSPAMLSQLYKRTASASRELALVKPAPELEAVHGVLTSALQMAVLAVESRGRAVQSNDMNTAWQASSAAAGALMLFDRARDELQRLLVPPTQ